MSDSVRFWIFAPSTLWLALALVAGFMAVGLVHYLAAAVRFYRKHGG